MINVPIIATSDRTVWELIEDRFGDRLDITDAEIQTALDDYYSDRATIAYVRERMASEADTDDLIVEYSEPWGVADELARAEAGASTP